MKKVGNCRLRVWGGLCQRQSHLSPIRTSGVVVAFLGPLYFGGAAATLPAAVGRSIAIDCADLGFDANRGRPIGAPGNANRSDSSEVGEEARANLLPVA